MSAIVFNEVGGVVKHVESERPPRLAESCPNELPHELSVEPLLLGSEAAMPYEENLGTWCIVVWMSMWVARWPQVIGFREAL